MSENNSEKKNENILEIPEENAPPLEELVTGEADGGNPDTREQIADPDFPENSENSENIKNIKKSPEKSENWVEVAKGKRRRGRPRKNPPEISPEQKAEIDAARVEKQRMATEAKIRANKASGIVTVSELGLLYLARRFGASEDEIRFRPDEKKALQEALEPLVSAETEDPWGNFMMVAMAVGGPRVAAIAAAREEKIRRQREESEGEPCPDEAA